MGMTVYVSFLVLVAMKPCSAFAPYQNGAFPSAARKASQDTALHVMSPDTLWANTLTTAVDVFDGTGVDPVVVSDVFWTRLQGNFISVLIGNFLAAIVFAFIVSQISSQLSKLGTFVTDNIFKEKKGVAGSRASTTFQRA